MAASIYLKVICKNCSICSLGCDWRFLKTNPHHICYIKFCFKYLIHTKNYYKQSSFDTWTIMLFWYSSALDWSSGNQIRWGSSFHWYHIYQWSERLYGFEKILSHPRISNVKNNLLQFCWSSWKWEICLHFSDRLPWVQWFVFHY